MKKNKITIHSGPYPWENDTKKDRAKSTPNENPPKTIGPKETPPNHQKGAPSKSTNGDGEKTKAKNKKKSQDNAGISQERSNETIKPVRHLSETSTLNLEKMKILEKNYQNLRRDYVNLRKKYESRTLETKIKRSKLGDEGVKIGCENWNFANQDEGAWLMMYIR